MSYGSIRYTEIMWTYNALFIVLIFTIWNLFVPPGRVVICFLEFYYQVLQEKN